MKKAVLLLVGLIACGQAFAQPGSQNISSGVEILKYSWEKVRIDWMKDPLTTPTGENLYELRTRVSNERRQRSAMEEKDLRNEREEKQKPSPPPRYVFEYKIAILNTTAKAIKEIDWDYIFTDRVTGDILGHREFTSVEKVAAGKRKELKITVSSPPTKRVSVHSLGKNEHDGVVENVVISRILYDDGSIWQPAN